MGRKHASLDKPREMPMPFDDLIRDDVNRYMCQADSAAETSNADRSPRRGH